MNGGKKFTGRSKVTAPPSGFGYGPHAVARERIKARSASYTAACDFEHLILQADIIRHEEKNSRAAQMLENAADTCRAAVVRSWLARARPAKPIPKRTPNVSRGCIKKH